MKEIVSVCTIRGTTGKHSAKTLDTTALSSESQNQKFQMNNYKIKAKYSPTPLFYNFDSNFDTTKNTCEHG